MKKFLLELGMVSGISGFVNASLIDFSLVPFLFGALSVAAFLICLESYVKLVSKGE